MARPVDLDDLLSLSEAARMKGCAYSTLWRNVQSGRLPSVELGGRRFVRRDSLADWSPDS